jgi:ankyrin repeat protein
VTSVFLGFVRVVVDGDIDQVSRRLAATPALATTSSDVGATRQESSNFFFAEIAHYFYAGDTALHMAAAAFRRRVAELLVARGADCRARNRRGAEPLHYAADANRWDPTAQAETIEYLLSIGADPSAVDGSGVAPLHRAVRTRAFGWRGELEAAKQGGVNALAPCRSNHRARRERFSAGA